MKKFLLILLVLIFATQLWATGTVEKEDKPVKLVAYLSQGSDYVVTFEKMLEMFREKTGENIEIDFINHAGDESAQKIVAAYTVGGGPDLYIDDIERIIVPEHKYGMWADLSPYLASMPEFKANMDAMPQSLVKATTVDGRFFAAPTALSPMSLLIRKSWMDKLGYTSPPNNWDEMIKMAQDFQNKDPDGNRIDDTIGLFLTPAKGVDAILSTTYWAYAAGVDQWFVGDNPHDIRLTSPETMAVIKDMRDWTFKYKCTPADILSVGVSEMYDSIKAGKAGISRLGLWNIGGFDEAIDSDYIAAPFPKRNDAQMKPNYQPAFFHAIAVNKNSKHIEEAVKFITFFTSKEAQMMYFKDHGMSGRTDLDFSSVANPRMKYFLDGDKDLEYMPMQRTETWIKYFDEPIIRALSKILSDPNSDIKKELEVAEATIKQELIANGF